MRANTRVIVISVREMNKCIEAIIVNQTRLINAQFPSVRPFFVYNNILSKVRLALRYHLSMRFFLRPKPHNLVMIVAISLFPR